MSTTTTHFGLIKPEGSDNFNPLILENPAIDAIDAQMYINQNNSVVGATYQKSGNVHVITMVVPTAKWFTFNATDDYRAGETFEVNGNVVGARTSGGTALPDYAFRINSNVLACLNGGVLTVVTSGADVSAQIETLSDRVGAGAISYGENLTEAVNAVGQTATAASTGVQNINSVLGDTAITGTVRANIANINAKIGNTDISEMGNTITEALVFLLSKIGGGNMLNYDSTQVQVASVTAGGTATLTVAKDGVAFLNFNSNLNTGGYNAKVNGIQVVTGFGTGATGNSNSINVSIPVRTGDVIELTSQSAFANAIVAVPYVE